MKKVYIAGQYTDGDWGENVRDAINAAEEVYKHGYVPFIPHTMTSLWSVVSQKEKQEWLDYDKEWLEVCDAMIAISGGSEGVDQEIKHASTMGIPVYDSVEEFLEDQ